MYFGCLSTEGTPLDDSLNACLVHTACVMIREEATTYNFIYADRSLSADVVLVSNHVLFGGSSGRAFEALITKTNGEWTKVKYFVRNGTEDLMVPILDVDLNADLTIPILDDESSPTVQ